MPDDIAEDRLAGSLAEGDARALLIHGLLAGREGDPEAALVAIRRRLGARTRARRSLLWWAAGVAVALLAAIGGSLFLPSRPQTPPSAASIVSGKLTGVVSEGTEVPVGRSVGTGAEHAVLACSDGSRLEVAPRTRLTIHGRVGADRWRIELAAGAVRCEVPEGERPFRVCTRAGDVVTEGTRFSVRLAEGDDGHWGLAVGVDEGRVRVERPPLRKATVAAGGMRIFPPPAASGEGALLALRLLFQGEAVHDVITKLAGGVLEIEGKIGALEVEAKVAPDGSVQSYSRQVPLSELPATVRDAVRARFGPETQWVEAEVEFRSGKVLYEVTLVVSGKETDVKLDADGRFLEQEEDN